MTQQIEQFVKMVEESNNIVFFGGAGVSTESGIPDFRSVDGLYNQKYDYPPETILSHTFYMRKPEEFYRFYRDKMLCLTAKPNTAHKVLAKLEEVGKLKAVVTQNIDGLHQLAGSKNVFELHGSVHRNYCRNCPLYFCCRSYSPLSQTFRQDVSHRNCCRNYLLFLYFRRHNPTFCFQGVLLRSLYKNYPLHPLLRKRNPIYLLQVF